MKQQNKEVYIPKQKLQYTNFQLAPPESFTESIEDSSACNIDDSRKELQAIQKKEVTINKFQRNNFEITLAKQKQKEKIFSKVKTSQDERKIKENILQTKIAHNTELHNQIQRKLSDLGSITDRELESNPYLLNNISKNNKLHTQPSPAYLQIAQQVYSSPKVIHKPQTKPQSVNTSNQKIVMTTLTTTPANEEGSAKKPIFTSPKSIMSPASNFSGKKFFVSEKTENFKEVIAKSQSQKSFEFNKASSMSNRGSNMSNRLDDNESKQIGTIGNILSAHAVIFENKYDNKQIQGIKSEANILRPILAFKKNIITQKQIIESMLVNDVQKFKQLMTDSKLQYLNQHDVLGNTLLILTIKLYGFNKKFDELLKELLKFNPDPFIKNSTTQWSAMDESLSQRSVYATALLFQQCYRVRRQEFNKQYMELKQVLGKIPNFQLEMHWNFDSPLPFIKLLAPKDTIKLWKFNQYLRLDSTLVGFSKLQCKRRDMTLLFTNKLFQINRSNNYYTDPIEELDFEEKKLVIHEILNCEPVNGALEITDVQVKEVTDWRGKKVYEKVGEYMTERFDLKITYKSTMLKKSNDTQLKFAVERELYDEWINQNVTPNINILMNKQPKEQTETKIVSLWMCKNHMLNFKDFNNIVTYLGKGNLMMERLAKVFERKELQSILQLNGFPVKVQIPFQFSIHATIQFLNLKELKQNDDLFKIPKSCPYQLRKKAQKIMEQKKKRLLLANLYL